MRQFNFVGIGVSRSGTTWTWQQLVKHPQVCAPLMKEAKVLESEDVRLAMKHFDNCGWQKVIGEYMPGYLHNIQMIDKINKFCPNARLLLVLRNPLERIFTQYKAKQWKEFGRVGQAFKQWFLDEKNHAIVASNNYMQCLPLWVNNFQDQLHITFYDEIVNDSLAYIQGVYQHIGIQSDFTPPKYWIREQKPYNVYFDKHPITVTQQDKNLVRKRFKRSIRDLEDFLNVKLGWL